LIEAAGFPALPLVGRHGGHPDRSGNDVLNARRLHGALRPGDRLVFDGGYVFPSVFRAILERDLEGIWIRRGLWQPGQITPQALQREAVFRRVIIPGEAFDELNEDYTFGPRITRVGPIVQDAPLNAEARLALRGRLAQRFGVEVREVIVSMLGGGVAADRVAQTQVISAVAEAREGCLHLILIWPGARVAPGLQGWARSFVVQTGYAAELCQAADLVVTAAGYNTFHECLYNALPTIFVPQTAPFMDDQDRRARAAQDRGLAVLVAPYALLEMEREVKACLDGKAAELRGRLQSAILPARGTAEAAAVIAGTGP
jgi:predicted glycosyltransferase